MKTISALLIAACICVPCESALSDTIHVSPGGQGIQAAIDSVSNGDTVLVFPGMYHELINFKGKLITVRSSDGPLATTITSAQRYDNERSINYALVTFNHGETRRAVLEGFTLLKGWIGIQCINAAPTIRRNILVGQGVIDWAAICLGGPGYPEWVTTGWAPAVIENNTIIFCQNGGISTFSTEPPVIKNNIIAFNNHYGIHREGIQPGVAQPALSYNDVYGSRVLYYEIPRPGIGSISANPLFDRSYRLMPGSPCIDAGDPNPRYNDPDGSRNDMGAIPSPFGGGPVPTNEWISVYCEAPLAAGRPLPPGTVIRAYDDDGVLCGRDVVRNDGSYGFMPIYRDDIYTDFDEGADPGDMISFTVNNMPAHTHPAIVWTAHGDVFELCDFSRERCLEIPLHEGWNLISWNVQVSGEIGDIIAGIERCVDVVLGFELDGVAYDPALSEFSTMRELDYHYGYWFRMKCDATLRVCGPEIPRENSAVSLSTGNGIHMYAGWNLISYWPLESSPVEEAFENVLNILEGASGFDHGAQVWRPDMSRFNTLTELRPGFGYWVNVSSNAILYYSGFAPHDTFDLDPGAARLADRRSAPSRNWMLVYGEGITLDGRELSPGNAIEFRTEDGIRCGGGSYSDGILKFTPVYGYDTMAESALQMPRESDRVFIVVNGNRAYPSISWQGIGRRIKIQNLFTDETEEMPASHRLDQNFPNPFNPGTTISFDLPVPGMVRLSIFTVSGQLVRTLVHERYPAGRHAVSWNGRNEEGKLVASGVYLYRLETAGFVKTKKMVISR